MALAVPKSVEAPTAVSDAALDLEHLRRMTFGDRRLERELLALFDQQASVLLPRMQAADAASVGALAHTLKGSALGVGAFAVAEAAAEVERVRELAALRDRIARLEVAIAAARAQIGALLAEDDGSGTARKG